MTLTGIVFLGIAVILVIGHIMIWIVNTKGTTSEYRRAADMKDKTTESRQYE